MTAALGKVVTLDNLMECITFVNVGCVSVVVNPLVCCCTAHLRANCGLLYFLPLEFIG